MKKYSEIIEEINAGKNEMVDTAKAEKEMERAAFMEAHKSGTPEEKETAREAFRAACERLKKEEEKNNEIKIKIEILKENAKQALFAENIRTICETWNKYEGKPHGEKTAQKIRDEIKSATGCRVYIGNRWDDAQITIYPTKNTMHDEITISPVWNGEKQPALNDNNRILKLDPKKMRVCYCGAYVENVDKHITELKNAHATALEALDAYRAAIDTYNTLTRGNMQRASDREGVKHYIV